MQDVRKGSLVRYSDDLSARVLKLGSTIGIVSKIHHDDLVVILSNGMTFIDRKERFVVLSY
jgi:sugar lactone lactonase YvrE